MATISDFIEKYEDYPIETMHLHPMSKSVTRVKLLIEEEQLNSGNTLYIGKISEVNTLSHNFSGVTLLLIHDEELKNGDVKKNNTVLLCSDPLYTEQLYHSCVKWLDDYTRYLEMVNELLRIIVEISDDALTNFVSCAAEFMQNPIILLDKNGQIISSSDTYKVEEPFWIQNVERGYCSYEQIVEIQQFVSEFNRNYEPRYVHSSFSTSRMCINELYENDEKIGDIIVFESSTPFSKINKHLYQLICMLAARIIHNYYQSDSEQDLYSMDNIILDCLSGKLRSYGNFTERIKNTPFEEEANYYVLIIKIKEFKNFDPRKIAIRSCFERLFKTSFMLWYEGNVVCIVEVSGMSDLMHHMEKEIEFFESKSLKFGISDMFTSVFEAEEYYRQALCALEMAEKINSANMFSFYNDYKLFDIVYTVFSRADFAKYLDNTFKEILEYDRRNHTEYYETIHAYINCSQNILKTSEKLHVHKNTIAYRVNKAKSLFGLDFEDSDKIFRLWSSFRIKRILDMDSSIALK